MLYSFTRRSMAYLLLEGILDTLATSTEHRIGSVVGEVVDQGKDDTVDGGDRQLGSARGEAEENTRGEGNEQNNDKGELEPVHFVCILPIFHF